VTVEPISGIRDFLQALWNRLQSALSGSRWMTMFSDYHDGVVYDQTTRLPARPTS